MQPRGSCLWSSGGFSARRGEWKIKCGLGGVGGRGWEGAGLPQPARAAPAPPCPSCTWAWVSSARPAGPSPQPPGSPHGSPPVLLPRPVRPPSLLWTGTALRPCHRRPRRPGCSDQPHRRGFTSHSRSATPGPQTGRLSESPQSRWGGGTTSLGSLAGTLTPLTQLRLPNLITPQRPQRPLLGGQAPQVALGGQSRQW